MTYRKLLFIFLLALCSCVQSTTKKTLLASGTSAQAHRNSEIWTLYSNTDTVCHVKRLVLTDSDYVLLTYDINTSKPEAAYQTLIKRDTIHKNNLDSIRLQYADYKWMPFKARPTLFVQLQASAFKDEMTALSTGHQVKQMIEAELQSNNLGASTAEDIGPGGANMLFEVRDIYKAKDAIEEVLKKEGLEKVSLIGKRIYTAKDDWFYEVIYPLGYSGVFLTM